MQSLPQKTDVIDDLIKKALWSFVVTSVMSWLISRWAFIGLGFINPIVGYLVGKVVMIAMEHLARYVRFTAIDAEVAGDVREYNKAVTDLAQKIDMGSPEETQAAKEEFKKRAKELIRFKK